MWPYGNESHAPDCFPVCSNMAFQTFSLFPCKVILLVVVSLLVVAEGQYKGFGKFYQVQDSSHRAVFEELWVTQKLDHFNGADSREWKQVSLLMCCVSLQGLKRMLRLPKWWDLACHKHVRFLLYISHPGHLDKCIIIVHPKVNLLGSF